MKLFIEVIGIFFILVIILYFVNKLYKYKYEYFTDPYGATVTDNIWGQFPGDDAYNKTDATTTSGPCTYVNPATKETSFGITYDNIKCYNLNPALPSSAGTIIPPIVPSSTTVPSTAMPSTAPSMPSAICHPNNTNFYSICRNQNVKYGIKKITPCNDSTSSVECGFNHIDGRDYGDTAIMTPCLNKSDDFDNWCRFYNNKKIPSGYNVNSIGAKHVLEGRHGDCYLTDGKPDTNSARAICDYNHLSEVTKLDPIDNKISYNIFTDCKPLKSNFVSECSKLLHTGDMKSYADQIMAYDCNPGFGRAKCLKKKDKNSFSDYVQYEINTITNQQNQQNNKKNSCC